MALEPLTISTAVGSLVTTATKVIVSCNSLIAKYKDAPLLVSSIKTECETLKVALSYTYWLINRDTATLASRLASCNPLSETFDVSLTGCTVVFASLDQELSKVVTHDNESIAISWKKKASYIWNEDSIRMIIDRMRGLQGAVNLLLTVLQTESLANLTQTLRDGSRLVENVRESIRAVNSTIHEDYSSADRIESIFESIEDDTQFAFDDEVINSKVYRRVLASLKRKANESTCEEAVLEEPTIEAEAVQTSARGLSQLANAKSAQKTNLETGLCERLSVMDTENGLVTDTFVTRDHYHQTDIPFPVAQEYLSAAAHTGHNLQSNFEKITRGPIDSRTEVRAHPIRLETFWIHWTSSKVNIESMRREKIGFKPSLRNQIVCVGDGYIGKTMSIRCGLNLWNPNMEWHSHATVFNNYTLEASFAFGQKTYQIQTTIWDTSGVEDYDRLRPLQCADADAALICFSLRSKRSLTNVKEKWISEVLYAKTLKAILLVGLWNDYCGSPKQRKFSDLYGLEYCSSQEDGRALASEIGATAYVECKADDPDATSKLYGLAAEIAFYGQNKAKMRNTPLRSRVLSLR